MSKDLTLSDKKGSPHAKTEHQPEGKQISTGLKPVESQVLELQKKAGNQAVQRLLAQRKGGEGFDLDQDTANRINSARGGGQPLDSTVQAKMSEQLGHDFSGVRVHTSAESDGLNKELSAKAFTTGQDVFFKQGAYDPGSSSGQELLAHELTHVVQQSTGQVPGSNSGGMTVRPAGDSFEQEADRAAKQATSSGSGTTASNAGQVQRQEEIIQAKSEGLVQRGPNEEDELQQG
ncbi:MAG TPA: DUF4157 domain-containing protein [Anaerolineae bacterium]|nr:DUF4157 domain-containing protein [Anaerolineae bacterium]HMR65218.1 DUF4157 domain-containing protein [Anaerolineae bacterium]